MSDGIHRCPHDGIDCGGYTHNCKDHPCATHFSEALTAYRDAVWREACEAMRDVCEDAVTYSEPGYELSAIRCTNIPEPKNPQA